MAKHLPIEVPAVTVAPENKGISLGVFGPPIIVRPDASLSRNVVGPLVTAQQNGVCSDFVREDNGKESKSAIPAVSLDGSVIDLTKSQEGLFISCDEKGDQGVLSSFSEPERGISIDDNLVRSLSEFVFINRENRREMPIRPTQAELHFKLVEMEPSAHKEASLVSPQTSSSSSPETVGLSEVAAGEKSLDEAYQKVGISVILEGLQKALVWKEAPNSKVLDDLLELGMAKHKKDKISIDHLDRILKLYPGVKFANLSLGTLPHSKKEEPSIHPIGAEATKALSKWLKDTLSAIQIDSGKEPTAAVILKKTKESPKTYGVVFSSDLEQGKSFVSLLDLTGAEGKGPLSYHTFSKVGALANYLAQDVGSLSDEQAHEEFQILRLGEKRGEGEG